MKGIERIVYIIVIISITIIGMMAKRNYKLALQRQSIEKTAMFSGLNKLTIIEQFSEDCNIDGNQLLINENEDSVTFESLSKTPKLVLYFNSVSCNVCIDSLLNKIQKTFGNNSSKVVIISSREGYRDLQVQLANNTYNFPYYCLLTDFEIPIDDLGIPFLFWLDQQFITKHLFVPRKDNPSRTLEYLSLAKNRMKTPVS